jgi:hypothetical protein
VIDVAALAEDYRERMRREQQAITPLMLALALAVEAMDAASRTLDAQTARWPVLLHRDDALTVWVDVPKDAVGPGPTVGESLRANAARAVAGADLAARAWDQALALRRLTSTLAEMAEGAATSAAKYKTLDPAGTVFDPVEHRAGDLVGQAVWILRTAVADRGTARSAVGRASLALWVLGQASPPEDLARPPTLSFLERMVEVVEAEVALALVLPGLGVLVAGVGAALDHELRTRVLGGCLAAERRLYDERQAALEKLIPGRDIWEYLYATDWVLRHDIIEVVSWLAGAAPPFFDWLRAALTAVSRKARELAFWLNLWMSATDALGWMTSPLGKAIYDRYAGLPGPDFSAIKPPPFPKIDPKEVADFEFALTMKLHDTRRTAVDGITTIANTAKDTLDRAGKVVEGLGPSLSRTSTVQAFTRYADDATRRVFGAELDRLARPAEGPSRFAGMAAAFERDVLTGGGFDLVAGLIPGFLAEAGRTWADIGAAGRPTSPHILARHGRYAGARVPEVTIRAGRDPDDALAAEVAHALRGVIAESYVKGRSRFAELASQVGP